MFSQKLSIFCRFYHIDTAFCPLNEEVAIYYKYAFDHLTQHNMRNETGLIEVSREQREYEINFFLGEE